MQKAGYVYVVSNPCVKSRSGKRVFKVGFTNNLPERLGTLNTSAPENFTVDALFYTENCTDIEKFAKEYIGNALVTSDGARTEFFNDKLSNIVNAITKCFRQHKILFVKCNGSVYVGRSKSAICASLRECGLMLPLHNGVTVNQFVRNVANFYKSKGSWGYVAQLLTGRKNA